MNNSNENWHRWVQMCGARIEMRCLGLLALVLALAACDKQTAWQGSLQELLRSQPEQFATVLQDPENFRVQILYTQIDRDADNNPTFRSFDYRLSADEYFYPASTVKLPTAALALEKINQLGIDGLTRDTTMLTGAEHEHQTVAEVDLSSASGKPSVAHYVRKILLVSDNDAFNRLYEFLSQEGLNNRMAEMGFADTRIMHRLEIALDLEANRNTNPIRFVDGEVVVYEQSGIRSATDYSAESEILLGEAEIVAGERLQRPKDFATKNAYPLQAQQDVIKALMFPQHVAPGMRFDLTAEDYRLLYDNMSGYPGDSGIADYENAERYPDGYVKFLMYGGNATSIPENIRIYNKVGDAYGFLTDSAYIVDTEKGIEFLLAATIFTNANQTFNDNEYEYDDIALPFLENLGRAIYEIEEQRERAHRPNFDWLGL